jgi:hypothetical protein
MLTLGGCYAYQPRPLGQVAPGAEVSARITDFGRIALTTQLASEVALVDGSVVEQSDSSIRLNVSRVQFLSGLESPWSGQFVTLRPQDFNSLTQRTYSRSRTMLAVIAGIGAVALLIATAVITGVFNGNGGQDKPPDGNPDS